MVNWHAGRERILLFGHRHFKWRPGNLHKGANLRPQTPKIKVEPGTATQSKIRKIKCKEKTGKATRAGRIFTLVSAFQEA